MVAYPNRMNKNIVTTCQIQNSREYPTKPRYNNAQYSLELA